MKNNSKIISIILAGVALVFAFQNCSQLSEFKAPEASSDSTADANNIDNGIINQAPRITCKIIRDSDSAVLRVLDTISTFDTFNQALVETQAVHFDCGASTDDSSQIQDLTFEINLNTKTSVFQPMGVIYNYTFAQFGTYPMSIRVTDKNNLSTVKTFTAYVQCAGSRPALEIDESKISVAAGSGVGYFDFNATGAVSGGSGTYTYSWDFNGDGRSDLFDLINPIQWSSSPSAQHVYTSFGNSRKISLQVMDTCYASTKKEFSRVFNIPRIPAGNLATKQAYYYLQADIRPNNVADTQKTSKVDFIGTQLPGLSEPKRVTCDYNLTALNSPTGFTIKAINTYDNTTNSNLFHGMNLSISNILDDGSANQSFSSTDSNSARRINLTNLDYMVAESQDGMISRKYRKAAGCTATLRLERANAVTPCSPGGLTVPAGTVTILGEYSCPQLSFSGQSDLAATNGFFFCEVSYSDQCVGGGGGGGGGQPPKPQ